MRRSLPLTACAADLILTSLGRLAQLARAPARHAGGHWFKSSSAHSIHVTSRTQLKRTSFRPTVPPGGRGNKKNFFENNACVCSTRGYNLRQLSLASRRPRLSGLGGDKSSERHAAASPFAGTRRVVYCAPAWRFGLRSPFAVLKNGLVAQLRRLRLEPVPRGQARFFGLRPCLEG